MKHMTYKPWSTLIDEEGNEYKIVGSQMVRDNDGEYHEQPVLAHGFAPGFIDMDMSKYKQKES